ncbi:rhomboid family intramembrane serine protease [Bailinhaonella thermotolerans]|uniref:Rhomboid family intramembrane serine protease n=1 Tax=Bailinhaonella thermotolerans TaxID=1070861 RepID=A0A3A4B254_9ACTN|nr:rhomboid family intramembrane serine protease [Bailinhaonella thermotolerans]RJL32183.1 rhomboid family intramembrane serine protease [Bailinhaonella thermotolerans]
MTDQPPAAGPQPRDAVPTCYRHPGRETYVRCQRCERPICPDCMREAAVGHQCVECVAEGNRGVRQARTVFGGRVTRSAGVTWALIAANVLAFMAQYAVPGFTERFLMSTIHVNVLGEWWRLLTSAFLHSQTAIYHIVGNMLALYLFGPELERRLGHLRFAGLYLLSAIGGGVAVYLFGAAALGASGAVWGLLGAVIVFGRKLGFDARYALVLLAINVVITFVVPGISWQGHLGGLAVGVAVAAIFAYAPAKNRQAIQLAGVLAVLVVLMLVVLAAPPFDETVRWQLERLGRPIG